MLAPQPPRLAIALLERLVADSALIGDLIEEFGAGRSRLWFWQQALLAMLIDSFQRGRDPRPLKLCTAASPVELASAPAASKTCDRRVPGIGAFGLIALGALMTATLPELWWFVVYGVTGGAVFGVAMVIIHRRRLV
jgi:hypothetical protein